LLALYSPYDRLRLQIALFLHAQDASFSWRNRCECHLTSDHRVAGSSPAGCKWATKNDITDHKTPQTTAKCGLHPHSILTVYVQVALRRRLHPRSIPHFSASWRRSSGEKVCLHLLDVRGRRLKSAVVAWMKKRTRVHVADKSSENNGPNGSRGKFLMSDHLLWPIVIISANLVSSSGFPKIVFTASS
jgi:hypothetical protein